MQATIIKLEGVNQQEVALGARYTGNLYTLPVVGEALFLEHERPDPEFPSHVVRAAFHSSQIQWTAAGANGWILVGTLNSVYVVRLHREGVAACGD